MKQSNLRTLSAALLAAVALPALGAGDGAGMPKIDYLTGDSKTACEVILCLSSSVGRGISECQAPLRRYFSIWDKKPHKKLAKRHAFLNLCPSANENAKMAALTTAIVNQEYACDAQTLNEKLVKRSGRFKSRRYQISGSLPSFCQALYDHEFTEYNLKRPKYVCDPNKWYSRVDWERGLERVVVSSKYNAKRDMYDTVTKDVPINKQCWVND